MNTFNRLEKTAGVPILGEIWDSAKDLTHTIIDKGPAVYMMHLAALTGLGLGAGWGAARLSAPQAVYNNRDKILTSEALATEIDVTERHLRDLEKRKKALAKRKQAPAAYDRFV